MQGSAEQDEMPAGMEKILGILETTMISKPIEEKTKASVSKQ